MKWKNAPRNRHAALPRNLRLSAAMAGTVHTISNPKNREETCCLQIYWSRIPRTGIDRLFPRSLLGMVLASCHCPEIHGSASPVELILFPRKYASIFISKIASRQKVFFLIGLRGREDEKRSPTRYTLHKIFSTLHFCLEKSEPRKSLLSHWTGRTWNSSPPSFQITMPNSYLSIWYQ